LSGEISDDYLFEVELSADHDLIYREETNSRISLLSNALKELTPRQKEAIYLRFNKELEYAEIAQIMDISIEACRNLISKAIANLKKQIR
jgi:RNA polymerase sigma factor (sigma-70 family)